ncbi:MAG: peptidoglycan editing factor PgeF [Rhodanobacteraceae bacterium]
MCPMWILPDWPRPPNVRAVTTTRDGPSRSSYGFNVGTRCGDEPGAAAKNRAFVREVLQLPSEPYWLQQVHGTRVVTLDSPMEREDNAHAESGGGDHTGEREPQADAAITRSPGVVLAIQTADCLPVLFGADDGSEIAAAHAGWRGLSAGVLENTLAAMRPPKSNIIAWLGPAIAAESYEVGEEVRDAFLSHDPAAASAFSATRPGHWTCDLYALARQRLRSAGVSCIAGGGFDTFTDPRLHSYRRDGKRSGRMVSLMWMLPSTA